MAPDFEYFFGLSHPVSHGFPGVLTFTLPCAMVVLVLFHALVKWPLISLLPHGLQARLAGPARRFHWGPPSRWLLILLSLAAGIATHLVFDSFTHRDGWAVQHWSMLRATAVVFHTHTRWFVVLQYLLTAVGAGILALSFVAWYRRAELSADTPRRLTPAASWAILLVMAATALIIGVVRGPAGVETLLRGMSHRLRFVTGVVITSTAVAAGELFAFSVAWQIFLHPNLERERVASIRR